MKTVEFHFDFGSPNAYFAHKLIPGIEARTGARFTYVPVLLGGVFKLTNNLPPMLAFSGVKNKLAYQHVEIERFIKRHGLTAFRMNPHFPVNTLLVMRGAVVAGMDGVLPAYVDAVFARCGRTNGIWPIRLPPRRCLVKAGLDGGALLARTQDQDVKDKLTDNTAMSVARARLGRRRSSWRGRCISARTDGQGSRKRLRRNPPDRRRGVLLEKRTNKLFVLGIGCLAGADATNAKSFYFPSTDKNPLVASAHNRRSGTRHPVHDLARPGTVDRPG